jgi:LuxR family transcriptional regulator, maltose regulon positive regulatory protein
MEEVLGRLPENIQSFLLRTSILDRLCGPLCDAVMNSPSASAQENLEYLERANLFIVPLDQERRWYRYHHLFADLLWQRLGQPQELSDDHLRASAWCEANDDLSEAFNHALAAGDFERAARLAEAAWQAMEHSFQTTTWLGWVRKLPDPVVCSRPRLCVQLGWAYSDAGDPDTSEIHLQNAERALRGVIDQDESKSLQGNVAIIRASNAQNQGDLGETVKYAELSLKLIPKNDHYLRASAAITLGFTHWVTGNVEASLQAMLIWINDMQRLGNQMFVIASAFAVADMQVILGRLGDAEKTLLQAIRQAAALGRGAELVTTHHHLGLALLAHEQGDDKTHTEHMQIAAELGKNFTLVDWLYRWNMAQALLKESAGDWDVALEFFDEARRVYIKNPVPMLQPVEAHKARVHLKQGQLDKAQGWVRRRNISIEGEVCYRDEYELLTLARVRMTEGSFPGVSNLLECLLVLAETQKRTGSVIEILLTQALVYQAQGNQPQALTALEQALSLAEPECYLRIIVDEGEPMRLLILDFRSMIEKQGHVSKHRLSGYANKLLASFPKSIDASSQSKTANHKHLHPEQVQVSEMIEPLTGRELEILHLIADGHSNAEIGQRLYLALSTVKGHNLRIFNKLQVQNRTEAVARARERGLL